MSVTRDTSQFEMSPLNESLLRENRYLISAMPDTSHSAIGPCGPLEQFFPFGDSLRHKRMAASSSSIDCGENAVTAVAARAGGEAVGGVVKYCWGVERKDDSVGVKFYMR